MRHKETGGVGLVEASRWSCGWMAGHQEKQPAGRTEAESYGPGPTSADRSVQTRTDYKNSEQVELVNHQNSSETPEKMQRSQDSTHFLFLSSLKTHYSSLAAQILFPFFFLLILVFVRLCLFVLVLCAELWPTVCCFRTQVES